MFWVFFYIGYIVVYFCQKETAIYVNFCPCYFLFVRIGKRYLDCLPVSLPIWVCKSVWQFVIWSSNLGWRFWKIFFKKSPGLLLVGLKYFQMTRLRHVLLSLNFLKLFTCVNYFVGLLLKGLMINQRKTVELYIWCVARFSSMCTI